MQILRKYSNKDILMLSNKSITVLRSKRRCVTEINVTRDHQETPNRQLWIEKGLARDIHAGTTAVHCLHQHILRKGTIAGDVTRTVLRMRL